MTRAKGKHSSDPATAVANFNARHRTGVEVLYTSHPGATPIATRTTSEAWVLAGHTAVVMVADVRGCVALDALEVVR